MRLSESMREGYTSRARRQAEPRRSRKATHMFGRIAGLLLVLGAAVFGAFGVGKYFTTHANAVNQACVLLVPDQPLSAQGLATPYQLTSSGGDTGACHEANLNQSAFVQGAILDPASGKISLYNPLVVDRGQTPAIAPTVPTLPTGAVVALWFGFNGTSLQLRSLHGGTLAAANCVNGLNESIFGQVAYCNAPQFFQVANKLIAQKMIVPPVLGTAKDGMPCPTVRDFSVVDQDQSDNVTTAYLRTANGRMAQDTAANLATLAGAGTNVETHVETNGSDNRLLSVAIDSALGCTPWRAPDLADNGQLEPALPLDELQAAASQAAPVALVPGRDPMVLVDGGLNLAKQNLYRAGVDQPAVSSVTQARSDLLSYCRNLYTLGPSRLQLDKPYTIAQPSLNPRMANNLFTFLAQRFDFTFGASGLGCEHLLNVTSPIHLRMNGGVTVSATIAYPAQGKTPGA